MRCGVPTILIYKCVCPRVNKAGMFKNARCAFLCQLVQTLNSVNMWVPKMVWWLME